MTNGPYTIGIDLGATKIMACVFDADFKPISRKLKKTLPHQGFESCVQRMIRVIDDALAKAGITRAEVSAIGVGSPGALDLNAGLILEAPALGWVDAPLCESLQSEFDCPVTVGNDVDMGVYAEYRFGAGRGARCVLGVFPGTGIGGGCVYDGQVIRGRTGSCVEIGHIPVMNDGPECGCGQIGCLEAVSSRLAIASAAARAAYCGQAPYLMKNAGTVVSRIRTPMIAESIRNGDVVIEKIVRRAARAIGTAVAGVIHLLAPDTIILGGGLVEAMPEIYLPEVRDAARQRVLPSFRDTFQVVKTELGNKSTALGAAAFASGLEARRTRTLANAG